MFTAIVETQFRAAHGVRLPDGSLEPPHEHTWQVQAAVSSPDLDNCQMVMDFHELQAQLENITGSFENQSLEQVVPSAETGATAEIVAKMIFDRLVPVLPAGKKLTWVEVTEAPGCRVRYTAD